MDLTPPLENPRVRRARIVVLTFLASNVVWAVGIPLSRTELAPWWIVVTAIALLALYAVAYVAVARSAVSPWIDSRSRARLASGLILTTVALWPVLYSGAVPGEEPWAWLAAFAIGASPLVVPWRAAGLVAVGLGGLAVLGAVLWGGSVLQSLAFSLVGGAIVAIVGAFVVWMLRLLVAAEAAREAEAALAVSEERLRFARELHDALGHRLTVISLKAELAAGLVNGLAGGDARHARAEVEEIRDLASTALQEARQAAQGYGTADLATQLRSAQSVLATAGIEASMRIDPVELDTVRSQLVAAVVRESITNLLRHSDARVVRISLTAADHGIALVIVNDRPHSSDAGHRPGIGLAGLADRAAQLGARLVTARSDDEFEVRLDLDVRHAASA